MTKQPLLEHLVDIIAIICLTILGVLAICYHVNTNTLLLISTLIAGIAGYRIRKT